MGGDTNLKTGVASCTDSRCTLNIWCKRPDGSPAAGLPYTATLADGRVLKGTLDAQGHALCKKLFVMPAKVELGERVDENELIKVREEIKDVLNGIIQEEKKEAEKIAEEFDKKSTISQAFSLFGSFLTGFTEAVEDAVEFVVDVVDLLVPIDNAFQAAWKAYNGEDGKWVDTFVKEFSDSNYQDLVDALGFDPAKIKKEDFAKAYEIANHIYDDAPTREILANFAVDYVGAQHVTEVAQFSGGMAFEIVLIALLVIATGGAGAVVAVRHAKNLEKLGGLFENLGELLKKKRRHKIDTEVRTDQTVRKQLDELEGVSVLGRLKKKKVKCFCQKDYAKGGRNEYDRQLKMQQDGINNMSAKDYLANRRAYTGVDPCKNNKMPEGKTSSRDPKIGRDSRKEQMQKQTEKYTNDFLDKGFDPDKAESLGSKKAARELSNQAALHNQDMIAGGNDVIGGFGESAVNTHIGTQWKGDRIRSIDQQACDAEKEGREDEKMNTELRACGKKEAKRAGCKNR